MHEQKGRNNRAAKIPPSHMSATDAKVVNTLHLIWYIWGIEGIKMQARMRSREKEEKCKLPLQYNATFCEQQGDFVKQHGGVKQ